MNLIYAVKATIVDFLVNTANIPEGDLHGGDAKLSSLNIDSLSWLEMFQNVEEKYMVSIPEISVLGSMSVDDMVHYIANSSSASEQQQSSQ